MKKLIIMRHAKAEKDAESGEDFDRHLADRGQIEARLVAEALMNDGYRPDLALVSKSMRTSETFMAVCSVFGEIKAVVSDSLYNADSNVLRQMIEANEDTAEQILVIAHNPGVQYLVMEYLNEGAASMDVMSKIVAGYPTATATAFEVDVAGRPLFEGLYRPKDLGAQ